MTAQQKCKYYTDTGCACGLNPFRPTCLFIESGVCYRKMSVAEKTAVVHKYGSRDDILQFTRTGEL